MPPRGPEYRQANGNFQLRSPELLRFPSPLPHARPGAAVLPARAHARLRSALPPRPGRDRPVPRRRWGPGVLALSSPGRSSRQLRAGLPHALLHARPTTRAGSLCPGHATVAPGRTRGPRTPRPRWRPEGTARGRDRGTEDGRPLPTSVRAGVAPAQPSRRSRAPSSARPAPAAAHARSPGPRHPPTRGRPRAAPAAGRAAPSAAGAGERERASAERARSGHGTGTERAGARARGAGGRGARVRGGRVEREVQNQGGRRGKARGQGARRRAGSGMGA